MSKKQGERGKGTQPKKLEFGEQSIGLNNKQVKNEIGLGPRQLRRGKWGGEGGLKTPNPVRVELN